MPSSPGDSVSPAPLWEVADLPTLEVEATPKYCTPAVHSLPTTSSSREFPPPPPPPRDPLYTGNLSSLFWVVKPLDPRREQALSASPTSLEFAHSPLLSLDSTVPLDLIFDDDAAGRKLRAVPSPMAQFGWQAS